MSLFAASMVGWVLYQKITGVITVPGWTTVVILLAFISGFSQLSLGILGEYVVRMLKEVQGEPRYVVRSIVRQQNMVEPMGVVQPLERKIAEPTPKS